ncbi:MAG: protoglobin domain-containing protein [Myxococcota bacterium]
MQHRLFDDLKRLVGFGIEDAAHLVSLAPLFMRRGHEVSEVFLEVFGDDPETSDLLEGRIEAAAAGHRRWVAGLFGGAYGPSYFAELERIGLVHVRLGIPLPLLEAALSVARVRGDALICEEVADRELALACRTSLDRLLDLNQIALGLAYEGEHARVYLERGAALQRLSHPPIV